MTTPLPSTTLEPTQTTSNASPQPTVWQIIKKQKKSQIKTIREKLKRGEYFVSNCDRTVRSKYYLLFYQIHQKIEMTNNTDEDNDITVPDIKNTAKGTSFYICNEEVGGCGSIVQLSEKNWS